LDPVLREVAAGEERAKSGCQRCCDSCLVSRCLGGRVAVEMAKHDNVGARARGCGDRLTRCP
jgi:hypothetical protein